MLTTAVDANAIFPAVVVVNIPVGIIVICPPVVEIGAGAVIVAIAVVPETKTICVVGAIVVALAIVGAAALVETIPLNFVPPATVFVPVLVPILIVLAPAVPEPIFSVPVVNAPPILIVPVAVDVNVVVVVSEVLPIVTADALVVPIFTTPVCVPPAPLLDAVPASSSIFPEVLNPTEFDAFEMVDAPERIDTFPPVAPPVVAEFVTPGP